MPVEITMPKLSQTTEEVRLIRWLVQTGDTINKGDPLCEVENDKTTMEVESFAGGTVLSLSGEPDSMIVSGTVIAVLGDPGKKASDATAAVASPATASPEPAGPATRPEASQAGGPARRTTATTQPAAPQPAAPKPEDAATGTAAARLGPLPAGVNASYLVQNIANKKGIDLSRVKGTGSGGRITKKDLETFLESGMESPLAAASAAAAVEPAATGAAAAPGTYLSENQKMIGRNLQVSKAKIPHYYLKISILSDSLLSWRQANILPDGSRVSINAILIYAAARALKRFPRLNACFRESQMQLNPEINVGLAVSAGEDLYVPVVRGAGEKGIQEIDQELKWLVVKAQNGRLEPEDLNGGTFTVSNLGMYPVDEFCAIISPPQVAILAFGRIRKEVVVDAQGAIQIRSTCVATGSFDHRIVNGAQGAAFLAEVKKIVEEEL